MLTENRDLKAQEEQERMRYILAGTNPRLYASIFHSAPEEEEGIIWTTPQSPEEVDELLALMGETFVDQEII